MPSGVDETKWNKAKSLASKQGKDSNYPYIMPIYKKLKENAYYTNLSTYELDKDELIRVDRYFVNDKLFAILKSNPEWEILVKVL